MHYEKCDEHPLSLKEKRERSERKKKQLLEKGKKLTPLEIKPREKIAKTFWSKSWCENLNRYEDLDFRLQEGRALISTNGIFDLCFENQKISALVFDNEDLYQVKIKINSLNDEKKKELKEKLTGKLSSVYELLSGNFSEELSKLLCSKDLGLFPEASEIHFECNCTDYASLCSHASAALIGLSKSFDEEPGKFFTLRGIDPLELLTKKNFLPENISEEEVSKVFGIELG